MQECKHCGTDIIETEQYEIDNGVKMVIASPPYIHANGYFQCAMADRVRGRAEIVVRDEGTVRAAYIEDGRVEIGVIAEPKEDTNAGS